MQMLGIFVGDYVGSRFEWNNIKTKKFELFDKECYLTDDSIMTLARIVTEVTHNHPEGIKGALATTTAVYMAIHGVQREEIFTAIANKYYSMNFTLDEIRESYKFDATCQGSVPQALKAFFESTDFEDAIRNAVSIGDTIAAIAGSVAGAYYGVPQKFQQQILNCMDDYQKDIVRRFQKKYFDSTRI